MSNSDSMLIESEKTNKEANELFKQKKFKQAIEKYTIVTQSAIEHVPSGYDPNRSLNEFEHLLVKALSNRSQYYINLKDYRSANSDATSAAMFSKRTHIKSIYRSALSFYKMGDTPSALQFIDETIQLEPNNAAALKLKQSIQNELNVNKPKCAPFVSERIKSVIADNFQSDLFELDSFKNDLQDLHLNNDFVDIKYKENGYAEIKSGKQCGRNGYFVSVVSNRYKIKWNHNGTMKEDVFKFYDISSVWTHKEMGCSTVLNDGGGPADYGFCSVLAASTYDNKPGFDSNLFWTIMIFWKYCGTTFIKSWDQQLAALQK